jgi:hypothetical protein
MDTFGAIRKKKYHTKCNPAPQKKEREKELHFPT